MGIEGVEVLVGKTGYDPSNYEREDPEAAAERKAAEVAEARQARAERLGHVEKPKKKSRAKSKETEEESKESESEA